MPHSSSFEDSEAGTVVNHLGSSWPPISGVVIALASGLSCTAPKSLYLGFVWPHSHVPVSLRGMAYDVWAVLKPKGYGHGRTGKLFGAGPLRSPYFDASTRCRWAESFSHSCSATVAFSIHSSIVNEYVSPAALIMSSRRLCHVRQTLNGPVLLYCPASDLTKSLLMVCGVYLASYSFSIDLFLLVNDSFQPWHQGGSVSAK